MSCELNEGGLLINRGAKQVTAVEAARALLVDEVKTARALGIDIAFGPKNPQVEPARLIVDESFTLEQ